MKIAGRKNDGAWFRTNKWLRSPGMAENLGDLATDPELVEAYDLVVGCISDMQARTSAPLQNLGTMGSLMSAGQLLSAHLATGIPRTVYMGKLAWDVYSGVGPGDVFPRQFFAKKTPGFGWVVDERVEGGAGELAGLTNAHDHIIYHPRNAAAMAAAGLIIRDRLKLCMLAFRATRDIYNLQSAAEGNPGGIADAHKDGVD